jgi:hypothetical protein
LAGIADRRAAPPGTFSQHTNHDKAPARGGLFFGAVLFHSHVNWSNAASSSLGGQHHAYSTSCRGLPIALTVVAVVAAAHAPTGMTDDQIIAKPASVSFRRSTRAPSSMEAGGKMRTIRKGTNGFTCMITLRADAPTRSDGMGAWIRTQPPRPRRPA